MKYRIIILLLSFSFLPLHSQKKWTLDECIDYAIKNNIDLKKQSLEITTSKIQSDNSKLNYVPNLDFNTNYQYRIAHSLDPTTYSFVENTKVSTVNTDLTFGLTIFDGMKRYYTYRKSLSDITVSQADYEVVKKDISLAITMEYMNILLNKEIILSIKRQIEISDANIKKAQNLYKEGALTNERLQNILIQRDNELYSLADAESVLQKSIINLCMFLNISDYNSFDIEEDTNLPITNTLSLADFIASIPFLPQMELAKSRLKSAEYSMKIARSNLYPTLSLGATLAGNYSSIKRKPLLDEQNNPILFNDNIVYGNYPLFSQLNDTRNGVIGLTLSMPLFNVFQTSKNISLAKNNIRQIQYDMENAEQKLKGRIYELYSEIETAQKKHKAATDAVERGNIVLSHIENKLNNGTLVISDYIIGKENLLIAEAKASQAKYEYAMKIYLLKFYYQNNYSH